MARTRSEAQKAARRTGKPPGRPRKDAQATPAAEAVLRGEATDADAAAAHGVSPRLVRQRVAEARAAHGGITPAALPSHLPPAQPKPHPLPDRRAALLALLAQALEADPALVEALPLDAADLARRLSDAGLVDEGDLDELAILGRVQARLEADMKRLLPDAVVARKGVAATLATIAGTAARIRAGRPPETETPEQIAARLIRGQAARAVERIKALTGERARKLAAWRAGLGTWAAENLGPAQRAELERWLTEGLGAAEQGQEAAA